MVTIRYAYLHEHLYITYNFFHQLLIKLEAKEDHKMDVLQAIRFAEEAWREQKQSTLANCFRHAGFQRSETETTAPTHAVEETVREVGNIFERLSGLLELPVRLFKIIACFVCFFSTQI